MPSEHELKANFNLAVQMGTAMAVAGIVAIGWGTDPFYPNTYFPLFSWAGNLGAFGFIEFLKLGTILALIFHGPTRGVLIYIAAVMMLNILSRYSAIGAFGFQVVLNVLFFAAILRKNGDYTEVAIRDIQKGAALFVAIMFISAGIQKVNSSYLSGFEFHEPSGFFYFFNHFFGHLPKSVTVGFLPIVSIGMEIIIGLGMLWRPKLFAHLSLIFILVLALTHPNVLYVYLTIGPMLLLIEPGIVEEIRDFRLRRLLTSVFFWAPLPFILGRAKPVLGQSAFNFFLKSSSVSFALIVVHFALLLKLRTSFASGTRLFSDWDWKRQRALWALLVFTAATPIMVQLGGPSPLGFTMFSGRGYSHANHQLKVADESACNFIQKHFLKTIATDTTFYWLDKSVCLIGGPTLSGREYFERWVCDVVMKVNPVLARETVISFRNAKLGRVWRPVVCEGRTL